MSTLTTMTPRQRWLAAIRMQPVDRLLFWPKINASYAGAQAAPFNTMSGAELHAYVGSDRHDWASHVSACNRKSTCVETTTEGDLRTTVYESPSGRTEQVYRYDDPSKSWHPMVFPATDMQSVRVLTECFADTAYELDGDALANAQKHIENIGEEASTHTGLGESPLMFWVEHLAGIENAHYMLTDHPGEVEALFDSVHGDVLRRAEVECRHNPADIFYMVENTSTTLISPDQYGRYCFKHISDYAAVARKNDRPMILHMCGHLLDLLPQLCELDVAGFEAFTSPTVGNTRLADGRAACPDKCLIGGTNAALWLRPAAQIIDTIRRDLDALPHHRGIVVTSAGVMPPACNPDTIREVGEFVRSYPARM